MTPFSTLRPIYRRVLAFLLGLTLSLVMLPVRPVISQVAEPIPGVETSVAVTEWIEQGRTYYQQGQWQDAIALWQQALQANGLPEGTLAMVQTYLGLAYLKVGDWDAAETAIAAALQPFAASPNTVEAGDRPRLMAQALNARGQLELARGQLEDAIATWQQVTQVYRTMQDAAGVTGSLINQASALEMNGYYPRACDVLLDAIGLDRQNCEVNQPPNTNHVIQQVLRQPDPSLQLLALRSLGNLFRLKGYLTEAHHLLQTSLEVAQTLNDTHAIGLSRLNLARVEQDQYQRAAFLADRSHQEGDRQQALELAQRALAHYEAIEQHADAVYPEHLSRDRLLQLEVDVHRFTLLVTLNRWLTDQEMPTANVQAQLQAEQATAVDWLNADLPPSRAVLYSQIHLAQGLLRRWQDDPISLSASLSPDDLRTSLEQLLQRANGLSDPQTQSYAWGTLGQFYEVQFLKTQQSDIGLQAQTATQQALGLAQSVQAWPIAYQWQWQLGRIYRAQGQTEKAIAHYQAAVETLNTVRRDLLAVESQVQFSFRDHVEPVYRELVALLLKSSPGELPDQPALQQAIEDIDALQLSELENFLSCNLTPTVALSQPQSDPTVAVLYPILLPDQLAVIARLPQSDALQFHSVAIDRETATQHLEQLRQQVEQRYLTDEFLAGSQQVYDWLIRPLQQALIDQQVKTLVFVSDGAIRNVPMAALYDGAQFLVERYAIAVSPGLQLPASTPLADLKLDAIAFGLSELRPNFPPHADFAPLANVDNELAQIATELPSREVRNQSFTSDVLQAWIRQFDAPIVHLATHGQFSSDPRDTFLLAWDRRITLDDFGKMLQTRENQDAHAIELLVLSACKTADGDNRATLGLAGIAIQSGARSTIGSLWYVDDLGTSELMGRLYQELANPETGITRAEALRRAQVSLLQSEGYRAPLFWAPYVLVGNWQ